MEIPTRYPRPRWQSFVMADHQKQKALALPDFGHVDGGLLAEHQPDLAYLYVAGDEDADGCGRHGGCFGL